MVIRGLVHFTTVLACKGTLTVWRVCVVGLPLRKGLQPAGWGTAKAGATCTDTAGKTGIDTGKAGNTGSDTAGKGARIETLTNTGNILHGAETE